jgi:hypothetical protein
MLSTIQRNLAAFLQGTLWQPCCCSKGPKLFDVNDEREDAGLIGWRACVRGQVDLGLRGGLIVEIHLLGRQLSPVKNLCLDK